MNRCAFIFLVSGFLLFVSFCATPTCAQRPTPEELASAEAKLKEAEAAYGPDSGTPRCSTASTSPSRANSTVPPVVMLESALVNLSFLYIRVYRSEDSEALLRRAFVLWDACPGPWRTQGTPRVLAQVLEAQGKFAEAEPVWRRLLQYIENEQAGLVGPQFPPREELAECLFNQGKSAEAEKIIQNALPAWEKEKGEESWAPHGLASLAQIYIRQGKFAVAEPLLLRRQNRTEKQFGKESMPAVVDSESLAELFILQGRYDEAEKIYRRNLEMLEKNKNWPRGINLPNSMTVLERLSDLYVRQGKLAEAEQICMHGATFSCIVRVYRASGKLAEAATYQQRIVETAHVNKFRYFESKEMHLLARIYAEMGRFAEAEPLCRRAREIRESFSDPVYGWGPNQPEIVPILETCAFILQKLDRGAEAEKLSVRAADIRAKFPFRVPPKQTP